MEGGDTKGNENVYSEAESEEAEDSEGAEKDLQEGQGYSLSRGNGRVGLNEMGDQGGEENHLGNGNKTNKGGSSPSDQS